MTLVHWLKRAWQVPGHEREALIQAVKMSLAALLAWALAGEWWRLPEAVIAPFAAVFMMAPTVHRSLTSALQQVSTALAGVALAFAAMMAFAAELLALPLVVLAGALLGSWRRFGAAGIWIPITGLWVLLSGEGPQPDYFAARMAETCLGAGIGVGMNMLVLPPVRLRSARDAVAALGERTGELLHALADALREGLSQEDAEDWLRHLEMLDDTISDTRQSLRSGQESLRFNPWYRLRPPHRRAFPPSAYQPAVAGLRATCRHLQEFAGMLIDTDAGTRYVRPGQEFTDRLADMLENLAELAAEYGRDPLTAPTDEHPGPALVAASDNARRTYRELSDWLETSDGRAEAARAHHVLLFTAERIVDHLAVPVGRDRE